MTEEEEVFDKEIFQQLATHKPASTSLDRQIFYGMRLKVDEQY